MGRICVPCELGRFTKPKAWTKTGTNDHWSVLFHYCSCFGIDFYSMTSREEMNSKCLVHEHKIYTFSFENAEKSIFGKFTHLNFDKNYWIKMSLNKRVIKNQRRTLPQNLFVKCSVYNHSWLMTMVKSLRLVFGWTTQILSSIINSWSGMRQ